MTRRSHKADLLGLPYYFGDYLKSQKLKLKMTD